MPTPRASRPLRAARPAATLLAALVLGACSVTDATAPDEGGSDAGGGGATGRAPSELVGEWRYGSVSPTNFWNDHTGVYSGNAYGFSDHYVFRRDGTYTEYVYIYTQAYNCRTQVWVEMGGTMRYDGEGGSGTFTNTVTRGRFKTSDSCASSRNVDRAMTTAEMRERSNKTHVWNLRTDANGRRWMQILDGRYERAN